jgi:glycine cleavage system aminomethyltransferase T
MATYRGHISKKLSGLTLAAEPVPNPGDKIIKEGKEIGYITSAVKSRTLGSVIALGYVKYGFFDPGTNLEVEHDDKLLAAVVVELPFYRRDTTR